MAYTSFRLRKTDVSAGNGGSAVRRTKYTQDSGTPAGSGDPTTDSGLKGDNYFPPIPASYLESSFFANVYERDRVELSWQLETALTDTPTASYDPTKIIIRASNSGEPVTSADGIFVVEVTPTNYFESFVDIATSQKTYIAEGKWVYYSMFVFYEDDTGGAYYERVAVLSVQIPINFGSTEDLWKHIPPYYRELDVAYALNTPNYEYEVGPLYRFVELFGWELDKMRTLVYDGMRLNDPEVIHSSAIDAVGGQLGMEFTSDALGTSKLRAVLNNIGYLRRTKGTLGSVDSYISALSGCGVDKSFNAGTSLWEYNIHPHRANLFTDPTFYNGAPTTAYKLSQRCIYTDLDDSGREYGWGVFFDHGTGNDLASTVSITNGVMTMTIPPATGTATVLVYSRGEFNYNNNLIYHASAVSSHDFVPRFITPTMRTSLEAAVSVSTLTYLDDWNNSVATNIFPTFYNPTRDVVGSIQKTTSVTPTACLPVYKFVVTMNPSADTVITFQEPLFEYRNSSGEYFDGNTPIGGFIPDATGTTPGQYDYHWGPLGVSSEGQHFSFYTMDYYRCKEVVSNLIQNYVVPVNKMSSYTMYWDVVE